MAGLKPAIPEVAPLIRRLYARPDGAVGCCLHIVLDDGNVRDDDVAYCWGRARDEGHADCYIVATLLRRMSRTQRRKLAGMNWYPWPDPRW